MADSFSDTSMLSDEERAIVERARAEHDRMARERRENPDREGGLPLEKTDFPIGIRPDGTVNLVEPADDE